MKKQASTYLAKATALMLALPAFVSCTKSGTISSSGDSSSVSGSITVSKVYPTSSGDTWTPIVSSSRYYIKGLSLSISGTCSRGVDKIKVFESGTAYSETATCDNNGQYYWTKTYTGPLDADKDLTVTAFDVSDATISGASSTVKVHMDNVAPSAPVITTPAASPYQATQSSSTFTVIGTCASDTAKLTYQSETGTNITPTGATTWQHDITLIAGSSNTNYTFYAHDLAGNVSTGTLQQISWAPTVTIRVSNIGAGAVVTDSGTSYKLEASLFSFPGTTASNTTSQGVYTIQTGFNTMINTVRAQ